MAVSDKSGRFNNSSDVEDLDEFNEELQEDSGHEFARIFGTEHPWFWRIHVTALVSLGISIIVSIGTLIFLICSDKELNIFKRKFSERLVVYLAVADILYSAEHTLGHIFAITTSINNGTFNEDICISSGFMLAEFICGQGMIVMITALSAFLMVVLNRKITFGRNDWALLFCSLGVPAVPGAIFAALGWFGPDGFWCFGDMRTSGGPIVSFFYSLFPVVIAGIITVCYVGVWVTIQVTSRRMRQFNEGEHVEEERRKYQKTAQTLTLFIIAYIAQWWAWITFCLRSFFGNLSLYLVNCVVMFDNLGGVFNFIAYTFVRRHNASGGRQNKSSRRREMDTASSSTNISSIASKYE